MDVLYSGFPNVLARNLLKNAKFPNVLVFAQKLLETSFFYIPLPVPYKYSVQMIGYVAKSFYAKFGVPPMQYNMQKLRFPKVLAFSKCSCVTQEHLETARTLGNFAFN